MKKIKTADFLCHHSVNKLMAQILPPKLKSVIMNCISVTYRDSFVPSKVPDTRVNFHFVIYFFFSIYEKMFIEFTNYFLYINLLGKCNNFLPQHRLFLHSISKINTFFSPRKKTMLFFVYKLSVML